MYHRSRELTVVSPIARYDREASRYHQGVYKRKRTDLLASLDSILSPLFLGQLKNMHKFCLGEFKLALADGLKGDRYNFSEVVKFASAQNEGKFEECAKEAVVVEGEEGQGMWVWKEELELLREEISNVADLFRKDETKKMVNLVEVRHFTIYVMT
jgi:protein SEY1